MKRAVIVHCWEGYPNYCWYPDTKNELEKLGFEVKVPAFPHAETPTQEDWVPFLSEQIGEPDEDLYLIGHSVGVITILRYLETLSEDQKIGGVVMVAGFVDYLGYDELKNYFEVPIDYQKIKSKVKDGFVAIHSDNDEYVDLKNADIFKEELGARVIVKNNMGHFSGEIDAEKSCTHLPEVVEAVGSLMRS
ncbi:MAG: alpha/beta hydrolase [Candidatus Colwellbacteria bacterium]